MSSLFGQDMVPNPPYCEKSYEFLKHHCYECNNYSPVKKSKVEKFDFLGKANDKYYYYGVYIEDSTILDLVIKYISSVFMKEMLKNQF